MTTKPCDLRQAHAPHVWEERSSVLKNHNSEGRGKMVPRMIPFSCEGVADIIDETRNMRWLRTDYYDSVHVASEKTIGNSTTVTERKITTAAVYERMVVSTPWVEIQRITCFCCTCDDDHGYRNDAYCRNHNMGFGMRPCEVHGTAGQLIVDFEDKNGKYVEVETDRMPESVQEYRRQQGEEK